MAMSLAQLTNSLNQELYTPRTDEQLQTEAENRYKSQYDQMRLTAQQSTQTKDQAYQKQLTALGEALEQDQKTLAKSTADSLASASRYLTTRGMQRSSYGGANAARIQTTGQNNLTALLKQFETDAGAVESDRALLAQQLADTLAQYDIDYLNDIQAYITEQKQIDYEREQEAIKNRNNILMALYEYGQQASKSSGGGGSRRRSSSSYVSNPAAGDEGNSEPSSGGLFDALSSLVGNTQNSSSKGTTQNISQIKKRNDFAAAMSGASMSKK